MSYTKTTTSSKKSSSSSSNQKQVDAIVSAVSSTKGKSTADQAAAISKAYQSTGGSSATGGSSISKSQYNSVKNDKTMSYSQINDFLANPTDASALNTQSMQFPTLPPQVDQMGAIYGANASLVNPSMGITTDANNQLVVNPPQAEVAQTPTETLFEKYMGAQQQLQNEAPSAVDTYNKLYKQSGLKKAEQDVQNYTSQINSIVAKAQADQMAVEGQGRGIPEVIVGGQQAQISKEAAIKALPLQALLANAQGNKELAMQHLDTAYKLEMQDAQQKYEYKSKYLDAVYNFASSQEKAKLDAVQRKEDQAFQLKVIDIQNKNDLYKMQVQNDYDNANRGEADPIIKTINGIDYQWNASTGTWETPNGVQNSTQDQETLNQTAFLRNAVKDAQKLSGVSGKGVIDKVTGFFKGDTKYNQYETLTDTLKTNVLTLAGDPAIRKFFGPQMSERDVEMMLSSGSTLNARTNSPAQAKAELQRIDDILNKLQTAAQTGNTGMNLYTAPDGTLIEIID